MNETINRETNLALMKQVERAVRPVPAGKKRKLQMREELLTHLMAIFEEELARTGGTNESAAIAAAFDRFGNPAEISAELTRSVNWNQRLDYRLEQIARFFDRWIGPLQAGDSLGGYSLRVLGFIAAEGVVAFVAFLVLLRVTQSSYDSILLPLTLKLAGQSVVSVFCYFLAVRSLFRAFHSPDKQTRWLKAAVVSALWLLVFTALSQAAWYIITEDIAACLARTPRFLLSSVLFVLPALLGTAWCMYLVQERNKPYQQWTNLKLEE